MVSIEETILSKAILGKGTYGSVCLVSGTLNFDNGSSKTDLFAKKTFKNTIDYEKEKNINLYLKSMCIKHKIDSIVKMVFHRDETLEMFMDYTPGYTLIDYCADLWRKNDKLTVPQFENILSGTIAAVNSLHSINIIHNDLKANNIMIKYDSKIYLIDFSLATRKGDVFPKLQNAVYYQAPELKAEHKCQENSDVFSLGFCFISLLRKDQSNFLNQEYSCINKDLLSTLGRGINLVTQNDYIYLNAVKNFLMSCINKDPYKRPVLNSVFLPIMDKSQSLNPPSNHFVEFLKHNTSNTIKNLSTKIEDLERKYCLKSDENERIMKENRELKLKTEMLKKENKELKECLDIEIIKNVLKDSINNSKEEIENVNCEQMHTIHNLELYCDKLKNEREEKEKEIIDLKNLITKLRVSSDEREFQFTNNMERQSTEMEVGESDISTEATAIYPMHVCETQYSTNVSPPEEAVTERSSSVNMDIDDQNPSK